MGSSDDEATHEVDVAAMRDALVRSRQERPPPDEDGARDTSELETFEAPLPDEDLTRPGMRPVEPLDRTGEDDALPAFSLEDDAPPTAESNATLRPLRAWREPSTESTTRAFLGEVDVATGAKESDALEISDADVELVAEDDDQTLKGATEATKPPVDATATALAIEDLDDEERSLLAEQRFGALVALLRQRLTSSASPPTKAAVLLKIAQVYERGLEDADEAFRTVVEAFEHTPGSREVVAEVDRLGRATGRLGELADRVKRQLLPGAPEDRRILYLAHLVFWYERALGKGGEISALVSEIERHDKVHPLALRRAAEVAAMNGDVKTQREHLTRALDRTLRREERALLRLSLATTFAGSAEEEQQYEAALEEDPTALAALQGLKRIAKKKESYDRVERLLERQIELTTTKTERVAALLELAELQEAKFLKREAAAELFERILTIEPAHPGALKGLERCYHALRDWPRLAHTLAARAKQTADRRAKIELFERAAEVHDSKLGDPAGAMEVYKALLAVDPKNRRALVDLTRLCDKLGDWASFAAYKARLAELAPTKRLFSQELVKLGDILIAPERDPIAARLQYERSVIVDPTNASAWEALQKVAAEAGDDRRVIECLEERRKHTEVPRQRAAILAELGRIHRARGDEQAARIAYEQAIRADASNEQAADAMLDVFTARGRWAEAAPLCELLVNAAVRDQDHESLFVRLRLATRIAAALGDADRAMMSAVTALDARPEDAGARADLIAMASQCRTSAPAALAKGRAQLGRIAERADDLTPDEIRQLADIQHALGDLDLAVELFERALQRRPEDADAAKALAEVYLAQGDYPHACKLKVDMARNATSVDSRFDLLCEAGEIWARRAGELETAASVLEEALALKPLEPWLLQTMTWLYGELGDWEALTRVLDDVVRQSTDAEERLRALRALAEIARDKLGDRARAADLYDRVLDIDKKRLDVFEALVRMLTEDKAWERLGHAYRSMIARVRGDEESQLEFMLLQQLGLIYRDRLEDAAQAFDVFDEASRLRPDHAETRNILTELLVVTDNLDSAVARLRAEIDRAPHDAQLYAELYELFLRQHSFDKAWCAVNVLARLREPTPEQQRFHEDYAPMPLDNVPGQIIEHAWQSHIFHERLDPTLTSLFALVTPVVARVRLSQLRPEERVGRPFTPTHSRMHDVICATFENAAEILSIAAPELLFGDPNGKVPFSPAVAPFGAVLVSGPAVEAQAASLSYLIGKQLAEQRPELAARAFFPSVPELASLLGTAVRVGRGEAPGELAGGSFDHAFAAALTTEEVGRLRGLVAMATANGANLDAKAWLEAADLSSTRAGLLVAGDIQLARAAILAEGAQGGPAGEHAAKQRLGELYKFATSDLHAELRTAIGVAVQT